MKLTEEQIEMIATYMADSLEDHLDIIFWDCILRFLEEVPEFEELDSEDEISDEDTERIVNEVRWKFSPKNDLVQ